MISNIPRIYYKKIYKPVKNNSIYNDILLVINYADIYYQT